MCLIGDACIINGSKRRQLAAFKQASPIGDTCKLDKRRQHVGVACIINIANSRCIEVKRCELIFSTNVLRHKTSVAS